MLNQLDQHSSLLHNSILFAFLIESLVSYSLERSESEFSWIVFFMKYKGSWISLTYIRTSFFFQSSSSTFCWALLPVTTFCYIWIEHKKMLLSFSIILSFSINVCRVTSPMKVFVEPPMTSLKTDMWWWSSSNITAKFICKFTHTLFLYFLLLVKEVKISTTSAFKYLLDHHIYAKFKLMIEVQRYVTYSERPSYENLLD